MFNSLTDVVPNILLIIAAVESVVFAISYGLFFNYRKTSAGRAVMEFVVALIVVFVINTIGVFVGANYVNHEYPGRVFIRTLGYGYLVYALGHLIWVLWDNWHGGHTDQALVEPKLKVDNERKERHEDFH